MVPGRMIPSAPTSFSWEALWLADHTAAWKGGRKRLAVLGRALSSPRARELFARPWSDS